MSLIGTILAGTVLVGTSPHTLPPAPSAPIPISGPTTITASGQYVVTQDFTATGQPAIKLSGAVDANIDFAGHTVTGNVVLRAFVDGTEPRTLVMRGGTLASGTVSAFPNHAQQTRLIADRMKFDAASIDVEDVAVSVTSCRFYDAIATIDTDFGGGVANFQDNRMTGGALTLAGVSNGQVRGNVFQNSPIYIDGSDGFSASNVSITANYLYGGSIYVGTVGADGTDNVEIARNTISGAVVIGASLQPWILQNTIGGCSTGSAAIDVDFGRSGRIEGNKFNGRCAHGIWFRDLSEDNEYSGNTFRTYVAQPILDEGTGNWDGSQPNALHD